MFDLVVVTAANDAQAKGYRAQLAGRDGFLVIADPGGRRVGSLGATVNVLRKIGVTAGERRRILVCHSGGDARRTPGYAAMGKAFVPMADSRPMLDHIIDEMDRLPSRSGVLVCCGDVVPYLGAGAEFAERGVTAIAYPDGPWRARRHGVYEREGGKIACGLSEVAGFRQKPKVGRGKFLIDTGIMFIDPATAEKMRKLPVSGDIYDDFPQMLLGGFAPFSVSTVGSCRFFHIGSSKELLRLLGRNGRLVDGVETDELELGGMNIVTNVPREYGKVKLARGECLTCLPLKGGGWYGLKYRVEDNFKEDGLWEKHGLGEKMKSVDHARLLALRSKRRRAIKVTAPVRIDFAGGWSDTPPICFAEGGTVLAAAVTLDGRRPIEVTVRPRRDRFVKIVSLDLGKRSLIKSAAELEDRHDPHDWRCLVKNALAVTGFRFGEEGLDITICANLPKGSGMGTSSMLGAATIAALLGRVDVDEVGALTLKLEQEMRTGGGWEDQFAGMVGGIKMLRSRPGIPQKIAVEKLDSGKILKQLAPRSLLYFTGQKRMARNVLRRVISFYAENPHNFAKILIDSVKRSAENAAKSVRRGDIGGFAQAVNEYWRDKKLLDAGSTNDRVEELAASVRPYADALTLAGAGGGGFMYILAKSPAAAKKIRSLLDKDPPSKWARFYDFAIDESGMTAESLV